MNLLSFIFSKICFILRSICPLLHTHLSNNSVKHIIFDKFLLNFVVETFHSFKNIKHNPIILYLVSYSTIRFKTRMNHEYISDVSSHKLEIVINIIGQQGKNITFYYNITISFEKPFYQIKSI